MLRSLRENGPIVLVPGAWTFVTAAHVGLVGTHPLFVAHVVMATIIALFAALSWDEMREGVLLAWRRVFVVGFVLTLAGVAGLLLTPTSATLLAVSVYGWMLLPVPALVYTGRHVARDTAPWAYTAGAALSALGAVVYALGAVTGAGVGAAVVGLTIVNVGQTAGIVNAVVQY